MKTTTQTTNPITEGSIWKPLLLFFLPIVFGTLFQQLYNTVDAVVVGRFVGKEALAAVGGSSGQILSLVVNFFVGLSSGASVIISQFYGAKDAAHVNRTLHTALAFSIVGSIFVTILGITASPWMLGLMNTPKELMADSRLYLQIYFGGVFFVFIYNLGSAILRAVGDSKSPLIYLAVCCGMNVVLDILLILVFHMGVEGAAIATVASQAVSAVLVLLRLKQPGDMYRLEFHLLRMERHTTLRILQIGLPAGLQSAMYCITNIIIQAALNGFGTDSVAAWAAFGKIDSLIWMVLGAMGIAVTTFVGQNYGAGKYSRMKKSVVLGLVISQIFVNVTALLFIFFGSKLFLLFTTEKQVIDIGMNMLMHMAPYYWIYVFIEVLSAALRGTGDVFFPAVITCVGVCLIRILWIFLVLPLNPTLEMLLVTYPITWIVTAAAFVFYYLKRQKRWT